MSFMNAKVTLVLKVQFPKKCINVKRLFIDKTFIKKENIFWSLLLAETCF